MSYTEATFIRFTSTNANSELLLTSGTGVKSRISPIMHPFVVKALQVWATGAVHATNPVFNLKVAPTINGSVNGQSVKAQLTLASGAAAARCYINNSFTPFKVKPGQTLSLSVGTANGAALSVRAGVWVDHFFENPANCTGVTMVTG